MFFLLGAGLYLLSNYFIFGGFMPVSGWMKGGFPKVDLKPLEVYELTFQGVQILWGWIPMIAMALVIPIVKGDGRRLYVSLFIGLVLKNTYIILFSRGATTWYWYNILDVFCASIALTYLAKAARLENPLKMIAYCVASVSFLLILPYKVIKGDWWTKMENSGPESTLKLIRKYTSHGDTILVGDWPGYVAFYSPDRNILAADLLTTNRRWYEEMRRHENGFDYIRSSAAVSGRPLKYILINGNQWLVFDDRENKVILNDPRRTPGSYPIGSISLDSKPIGSIGKAHLWRISE